MQVRERAQDMIEYGLLVATLAICVLIGGAIFGETIHAWFAQLIDLVVHAAPR